MLAAPLHTDRDDIEAALRKISPGRIRFDEPMARHTSIGVGGRVRFLAIPDSTTEIIRLVRAALEHKIDFIAIGRGSNLLVRQGGYSGLLIKIANNVSAIEIRKRTAYAEAGASFTGLGRKLTRSGRPGLEFAIGIPGSVGGAVRMNAGAYGADVAGILKSVKVIDRSGRVKVLRPEDLSFGYRKSSLPASTIVLSAIFRCPPGQVDEDRLRQSMTRKDTQPLEQRSFGSTFVNPPGDFAARMIEECGLKGTRRGGAMISEKHANFIVNVGDRTKASDVEELIDLAIAEVKRKFRVTLKPEVIIIGDQ